MHGATSVQLIVGPSGTSVAPLRGEVIIGVPTMHGGIVVGGGSVVGSVVGVVAGVVTEPGTDAGGEVTTGGWGVPGVPGAPTVPSV